MRTRWLEIQIDQMISQSKKAFSWSDHATSASPDKHNTLQMTLVEQVSHAVDQTITRRQVHDNKAFHARGL